jgi:4-amino-4-deoxy-L-arabinose transferase-like glycosyltransferase
MNSPLPGANPTTAPRWFIVCSIAALVWALAARIVGPSDAFDQTQPKTLSYTTDILVNGRWTLPVYYGEPAEPATKPPLYNWLAAPTVRLLGFDSEIGHRFPSIAALCLCWLVLVRLGQRLFPQEAGVGWLAGMMFVASYTIFKLGYLARPDMLLTLWLIVGWVAGTALLVRGAGNTLEGGAMREHETRDDCPPVERIAKGDGFLRVAFWACVALAALTKGPAALVLIIYALVGAKAIRGSWRASTAFGWWWGLPLSLALVGLWVAAAYRIDPRHVVDRLWQAEILGRVTGTGPEGNLKGTRGFVTDVLNIALFYLIRFAPWSIISVLAMIDLWLPVRSRKKDPNAPRRWRALPGQTGPWLQGAAWFVIVVVGLFTLSTGKRADYIAAAFGPGALLAAAWMQTLSIRLGWRLPWLAPIVAALALAAMTVVNQRQTEAPIRGFGPAIDEFIRDAAEQIQTVPRPVLFWATGSTHMKAYLGLSEPDMASFEPLKEMLARRESVWLIAGQDPADARPVEQLFRESLPGAGAGAELRIAVISRPLPRDRGWPGQMILFEVNRSPR